LTPHFKQLKLNSGRTIEEIETSPIRRKTFVGEYEISYNFKYATYTLTFFPKAAPNNVIIVNDNLLTFKDASLAQIFDYTDRLKALCIEMEHKNGSKSDN
jgi:hypothetical protein